MAKLANELRKAAMANPRHPAAKLILGETEVLKLVIHNAPPMPFHMAWLQTTDLPACTACGSSACVCNHA